MYKIKFLFYFERIYVVEDILDINQSIILEQSIGEHRKISVSGSVCLRSKGSRGSVGGGVGMGFRAMKAMGSDAASTTSKLCYLQ